jgi:CPA2 family monovalent cation:H+ antiporter-2
MRRLVFGFGSLQVVISVLSLPLAAMLLGRRRAALVLGGALALSSTAIVMPVLIERKRMNTDRGRTVFSILLFQDLMVAPLLFMVSMLDTRSGGAGSGLGAGLLYAVLPALA